MLWPIPGTQWRFGLDAIIGLIPGVGDLVAGILSASGLLVAIRMKVPVAVFLRMVWNLVVDVVIGEVPLAGDVLDVAWQANRKNLALLDEWRDAPIPVQAASATGLYVIVTLFLLFMLVMAAVSVVVLIWVVTGIAALLRPA